MAAYRIKLCGLNNVDTSSLKSMLSLASDQLTHGWEIVSTEKAELYIYSLDSDEGRSAWQEHDDNYVSALLSTSDSSNQPVDIILKRPLRTKNFSAALNDIENIIKDGKKVASKKVKQKKKASLFSSISSALSGLLGKKSNFNKPALDLAIPEQSTDNTDTILEPKLLKKWLSEIEAKESNIKVSDILGNLIPLNRLAVSASTRFTLLELYAYPIITLAHNQITKGKKSAGSHTDYVKTVHALSLLLEELCSGYKILIDEYYHQAKHPHSNVDCLVAINRVTEYLGLSILFAHSNYYAIPNNALNTLHQLYLYNEYYHTLHKVPSLKKVSIEHSFSHLYNRVLLTGIANPSRLSRHEPAELYKLMGDFADKVSLAQLSDEHIYSDLDPIVAGYFCLDTSSNRMPIPLAETSEDIRAHDQSRLLDTHQLLEAIEHIFHTETESSSTSQESDAADIHLLKKVIPQFNATYTRRFKRKTCTDSSKTNIAIGLPAIHVCLIKDSLSQTSKWIIHNRGKGGMMISSDSFDAYHLNIGDSVGIFEDKSEPCLAIIRWMETSKKGLTHIGLEIQSRQPKAVSLSPQNKSAIFLGLLLPAASASKQETTILVEKGTYIPLQELIVNEGNLEYKISVDTLINNTFNDEQFSFTVKD